MEPKMNPNLLEEELSNGLYCDTLLGGCQKDHITKLIINNHKYIVISMLG
jgi:hypothetical protein